MSSRVVCRLPNHHLSRILSLLTRFLGPSFSRRQVAKVVAPKKAKLEEMNSLLAAANATLAIKQVCVHWDLVPCLCGRLKQVCTSRRTLPHVAYFIIPFRAVQLSRGMGTREREASSSRPRFSPWFSSFIAPSVSKHCFCEKTPTYCSHQNSTFWDGRCLTNDATPFPNACLLGESTPSTLPPTLSYPHGFVLAPFQTPQYYTTKG